MSPVLDYCGPELYSAQQFEANIEGLSPQFVKIYNQALEAESRQLDEIAGIGYRKALEFLVKDYCKHAHPDESDEIERTWLKTCIVKFIPQQSIQTLASRAAWIGNDEAHYTRKHEDRDIADMKSFIQAMVHYIWIRYAKDYRSAAPKTSLPYPTQFSYLQKRTPMSP